MDISNHYYECGEGFPFILLHGNTEDYTIFGHQIASFSHGYHVYAIDTRGHGQTPRGDKPFTIRQFAEDLYHFMNEHQIEKAHILGFSDGGNIAMIFAIHHPERVERLILDGANMFAKGVYWKVQLPIEIEYRVMRLLGIGSKKAKRKAEMLGLMVKDPNLTAEDLANIQADTLVMAGTRDLILKEHTEYIAQCIPRSELVFVEGGHGIAHENPEDFNEVVWRFLER